MVNKILPHLVIKKAKIPKQYNRLAADRGIL